MDIKDTYRTITSVSIASVFKDKNSKFYGYGFPINSEDDVRQHINDLKKKHHQARHWCYAYQLGKQEKDYIFRVNDDGEPNNSAGMPIYGQIQSFDVTNILIIVVRYFGGTKLGVSGLINAYRSAAKLALEASEILTKTVNIKYSITFDYKNMNKVMRVIKENKIKITNQRLELRCELIISVRLKDTKSICDIFERLYEINMEILND